MARKNIAGKWIVNDRRLVNNGASTTRPTPPISQKPEQNKNVVNVRVEYESTPVRHLAIQCPHCQRWFHASDVTPEGVWIRFDYEIETTTYHCPVCEEDFGFSSPYSSHFNLGYGTPDKVKFNIQELGTSEEVYKDCVTKKVEWV